MFWHLINLWSRGWITQNRLCRVVFHFLPGISSQTFNFTKADVFGQRSMVGFLLSVSDWRGGFPVNFAAFLVMVMINNSYSWWSDNSSYFYASENSNSTMSHRCLSMKVICLESLWFLITYQSVQPMVAGLPPKGLLHFLLFLPFSMQTHLHSLPGGTAGLLPSNEDDYSPGGWRWRHISIDRAWQRGVCPLLVPTAESSSPPPPPFFPLYSASAACLFSPSLNTLTSLAYSDASCLSSVWQ